MVFHFARCAATKASAACLTVKRFGSGDARLAARDDRIDSVVNLLGGGLGKFARPFQSDLRIRAKPHCAQLAVDAEAINPRAMTLLGDLQIQSAAVAVEAALSGGLDRLAAQFVDRARHQNSGQAKKRGHRGS